jgi:hypothetical protein
MSETQRTRLDGHMPAPSTQTGGGCLILFGMPFIAIGFFVMAMSLGYLPLDEATVNGPKELLTVFGGVFATAGLGVAWAGAAGMARARAARKRKEEHPLEPWFWDHPWDKRWAEHGSLWPALQGFLLFLFLSAFLSMFHWWAFFSGEGPLPLKIFILIFDLIALAVLFGAIYSMFQYFKYGKSRLHFARFPFRPGSAVEAGLEVSRKIQAAPSISLTLRYIEEVTETTGSGKNRSSRQVLYCLHEVKQELSSSQFDINSQGEIPISMRLPQGDFSNRLLDTPRRYWELEIKAETPGIDYDARFLVPVYKPS